MSPFEASTGLPMRTPGQQPEKYTQSKAGQWMRQSLARSTAQLQHSGTLQSKPEMAPRTDRGPTEPQSTVGKTLKVGDLVKIFPLAEPSALEAEHKGQKAKHCMWYRGPARVMKRLSDTTYTVELCSNKRQYDRSIINVSACGNTTPTNIPDPPKKNGAREPIADTACTR